ncbi:MAG: hypothetical protein ACI36Y_09415 [Coriobacteriales bacterium]
MEIQWPLVAFTWLTGMGGWLLAFIAANQFTGKSKKDILKPVIVGTALVILGGFASILHLSHVERIMNALSNPTSGIFVEAVLVGIIAICGIVAVILYKREQPKGVKVFVVLAGLFGIVISFAAGESYIVMTSHAAWDTILLPVAYLGTATAMGGSLWWLLCCPDEENGYGFAALLTAVTAAVGLVTVLAYCAVGGVFGGAGLVLALVTLAFDAVALIAAAVAVRKPNASLVYVALVTALIAGFCLRTLMWVAGVGAFDFFV